MKLHIGSPSQLPFVLLTACFLLLSELAHQLYLLPSPSPFSLPVPLCLLTLLAHLLTSFRSPGILPNSNLTF